MTWRQSLRVGLLKKIQSKTLASHRKRAERAGFAKKWGDWAAVIGTVLHSRVTVYAGCQLGKRVTVSAGTVIGADGFGYERAPDGRLVKFPHFGRVIIEDDVEIGANVTIDRGTLGDTIIQTGSKIDNLVQIAHNVIVGEHSLVIAGAVICGSVRIGARCWVAPNAVLQQKVVIGDGVTIGMGAVVNTSVKNSETMVGYTARPAREAKRISALLNRTASPSR